MVQHVEFVASPLGIGSLWNPYIGPETNRLLAETPLNDESRDRVENQSVSILASCLAPKTRGVRTGLVVGYVQSGKTLSFTTVTALARDNGYALVVMLAGTKINLYEQTSQRLRQDLRVERPGGMSPWLLIDNPRPGSQDADSLAKAITTSSSPDVPEAFRQTVVITAMKNPSRLDAVTGVLTQLVHLGVLTDDTAVLVVDDEADQAGLNTGDSDDPTATYAAILRLRKTLTSHTYLMYTATPQAPLLINLADSLSPDFVRVLNAGPDYTGGEYFFGRHRASFVEPIPASETMAAVDLETQEPPPSLLEALAVFLVGVVSQQGQRQLAMLVHPSHAKDLHTRYKQWVSGALEAWRLTLSEDGPDRDELLQDVIEPAWRRLSSEGASVVALDQLIRELPLYLLKVQVRVVNSEDSAKERIQWGSAPAWVLVGGNKLDRGFTVEGLSVTYMPRGTGIGNADTIQQRARFFGYKRAYAEFCRAWLSFETESALRRYVEHEHHLRKELVLLESQGSGLKGWKRKMLLDPSLKPCRRAAISLPFLHSSVPGERWMRFERVARLEQAERVSNASLVAEVVRNSAVKWSEHPEDLRDMNKHQIATIPLAQLVESLLAPWAAHPQDRITLNQLLLVLGAALDDLPDELADVVWIRGGLPRERRIVSSEDGRVLNLQEGRRSGASAEGFKGDASFRSDGRFTLQLHSVNATDQNGEKVVASDLRGLAVWLPRHLAGGALVEAS